jgi:hypothetical protein
VLEQNKTSPIHPFPAHKGSKRPDNLREEHTAVTLKEGKQSSEAKKRQRNIQKLTMCTWKENLQEKSDRQKHVWCSCNPLTFLISGVS